MSRPLAFRAWDAKNARMVAVAYLNFSKKLVGTTEYQSGMFATPTSPDRGMVLMQYTGLKDKNGREIYEGDVIKWGDHCDWCHEDPVRVAEVKFAPDIRFHSQVGVFKFGQFAYQDTDKHIEVIGNIYEHKELLEDK